MKKSLSLLGLVLVMILGLVAIGMVAEIQEEELFSIKDPVGDDYGPGSYVYPTQGVFKPGTFDIVEVNVAETDKSVIFKVKVNGAIDNPWGAPNGFSVQMIHIYLDQDQQIGSGETKSIPGANVVFTKESAWEKAIIAEGGWGTEVENYLSDEAPELAEKIHIAHSAWVDGQVINILVPKEFLGKFNSKWGIQVLMLSQEGSEETMDGIKIRRVVKAAESEWQFGGGDDSPVHPNVIDMLMPTNFDQAKILSEYKTTNEYSVIPMVYPQK